MKKILFIIVLVLVVAGITYTTMSKDKDVVKVGYKDFTEQRLFGKVMSNYLKTKGFKTEEIQLTGTMLIFSALENKDIDVYPEYTGTGYGTILGETEILGVDETFDFVKNEFEKKHGITWLKPFGFNNTYVLSIREDTMKKYNIKTLDDLVAVAPSMRMGCDKEFQNRADGLPGLLRTYPGLKFKDIIPMDQGITYAALNNEDIDINVSYSTDGRIAKFNLKNLEDSRGYFPPYYLTPIIRKKYGQENPKVMQALEELGGHWTEAEMQKYNLMVDDGDSVENVSMLMLKKAGLVK